MDAATASKFSTQVFENPQEFLRILRTDALPIASFPGAKVTNNDLNTDSPTDASDTSHRLTSKDLTESMSKFDKKEPDGRLNRAELHRAAMTSPAAQFILANFELIKGLSNDDPGFEKDVSIKDIKAAVQILDRNVQPIDIFRQRDTERYAAPGAAVGSESLGSAFGGLGIWRSIFTERPPGASINGDSLSIEGALIGSVIGNIVGSTVGRATGEINYSSHKSSIDKMISDFDKLK